MQTEQRAYATWNKKTGKTAFGDRLKQERLRRNIPLLEFARLTGIQHSQITGYENRGVKPGFDSFVAIAQVLECSLDFLAGLEDEYAKS